MQFFSSINKQKYCMDPDLISYIKPENATDIKSQRTPALRLFKEPVSTNNQQL
jgi:hypothetical protein